MKIYFYSIFICLFLVSCTELEVKPDDDVIDGSCVYTSTIDFGEVEIGSEKTLKMQFQCSKATSLNVKTLNNSNYSISPSYLWVNPYSTYNFGITFKPTTVGNKDFKLYIESSGDSTTYPVKLYGKAINKAFLEFSQSKLNFGETKVNSTAYRTIQIKNTSNYSGYIYGLSINYGAFEVNKSCIRDYMPGDTCNLEVMFSPKSARNEQEEIGVLFVINGYSEQHKEILQLQGKGID